jgi:hypothetical protein
MRTVSGVSTNECPVSLISADSLAYLEIWERCRVMQKLGAALYGPSLAEWPIWAVDMMTVLEIERERTDLLLLRGTKIGA